MNQKTAKQLRRRAKELLIELYRSFLPEDTVATEQEILDNIPTQQYIRKLNGQIEAGVYSERWVWLQVKKNPSVTVEELKLSL